MGGDLGGIELLLDKVLIGSYYLKVILVTLTFNDVFLMVYS